MARKKVIDLNAEQTFGFGSEKGQIRAGEEISGYYLGSRSVKTGMGESRLHFLQTPDGNVGLWGSAQLNSKLEQIALGTMVFVTYEKKIKVPKGTMKVFSVEYDDEDTIEVGNVQMNFSPSKEAEDDAEEEEEQEDEGAEAAEEEVEEEEDDAEEDEEEEEDLDARSPVQSRPRGTAKPADAKTASSVEALLKKNKR